MFKNYLKITYRNFRTNKFYTFINITGLSIGLSCVILISLFVTDEMSFDTFHADSEQIHLLGVERSFGGQFRQSMISPFPLASAAVEEIPEVEMAVTITPPNAGKIKSNGELFTTEDRIIAASKGFFTLFNFPLLEGDPITALEKPNTVVISKRVADKYFPNESPIGKTLTINRYETLEYTVTGIAENITKNTYLEFDAVFSITGLKSTKGNMNSWGASMYNTFVKLQNGATKEDIYQTVNDAFDVHIGEARAAKTNYFFVPIPQLYLSELQTSTGFKGSYMYIYIFSAVALFVLLLASINYMNLSTARGLQRGMEVGVRKVLGANKSQLIQQFLGEAVMFSLIALVFAFIMAEISLPAFNEFFEKELVLNFFDRSFFIISIIFLGIGLGILSGFYPAIFLSRFKPAGILKGGSASEIGGVSLRKILVVFQFGVSTVLVIGTLVVLSQLNYLLDKDLGFNKEQTMFIPFNDASKISLFKETVEKHQAVVSTSAANGVPGKFYFSSSDNFDSERPDEQIATHVIATDDNYQDVLGLRLLAGSYFDDEKVSELENSIVINEAMQKRMNWLTPEDAIGQEFANGDLIIGVVNDFHFRTLRTEISPVVINSIHAQDGSFSGTDMLVVRFNAEQTRELIDFMQSSWKATVSDNPITYTFLDETMDQLYETDKKLGEAFSLFAGIGIFIACMGLFGLTAFSAERKTKEIGIRKVLGATVLNIVSLLSIDFIKLVAIGFVIAAPISWFVMNTWLTEFAYRIDIGIEIFLLAGAIALTIALFTTSWQSVKAANSNPVDSLKTE